MEDKTTKRPRGCFFYGCISGTVLLVLVLVGALVGLHYFKKMFNQMTDSQPMPLPEVQLSQAQMAEVQQRLDTFRQDVRAGRPTAPLALTADEINALIATDADLQSMKGKLYISIEGDQVKGQLSLRLDQLGLPMFQNRYLNAVGTFTVGVNNGNLSLFAQNIVAKGKPLPEVYMDKIRKQNLAQQLNQDPNAAAALNRLEQVQVKDGKLVIVPKATP